MGNATLGLALAVLMLVGTSIPGAEAQTTPLPPNLKIVVEDGVPPAVAAFAGVWVGRWSHTLDGALAVSRIYAGGKDAYKADAVYSWGTAPSWYVLSSGYRESEAEIKDGRLTIQTGQVTYEYTMADGVLKGVRRLGRGGQSEATFTKVEK